MSHNPLCSKLRNDVYCDCWERAAAAQAAENQRLRAELDAEREHRAALWSALSDVKATCDGRVAGESMRASYLGISNYIRRVIRVHAPVAAFGDSHQPSERGNGGA